MAYNPIIIGGGTEATAQRVTIANDSTGVLSVDDNGGSLTVDGTVAITSATLATTAKQDTGNTSIASIDTKTPSLGQALAAASVPVILPSATITTLTPPAAITGFALEAGNLASIKAKTDNIPAQGQALAAASLPVVLTAAQITTLTPLSTVAATQSGTWTVQPGNTANTTAWKVDGSAVTQPVSGTVTATIGVSSTGPGKLEDVAAAGGDMGIPAMAIQTATPADTAAEGDYVMHQMSGGRVWVDASGKTLTVASHAVTNAGTFAVQATEADGANTTLGSKADAKSTATDTTAITVMQVLKQISASAQAPPTQAVTFTGSTDVATQTTLASALTSLQLIDDVVLTDDAAFTPATSKVVMFGAEADETATDSVDEGDGGALRMTTDRQLYVRNSSHGKTIVSTGGSAASSGNNTLIAADASNKIKVAAFSLSTVSATAMTCIFQDGASGTELWRAVIMAPSGASAGANLAVPVPSWLFSTTANTLLNLNLSSANAVHWSVSYFKEAT